MLEEKVIHSIEEQAWIDRAADPIQKVERDLLHKAPAVADVLHGNWIGHPLHAAMVSIPVGAWATALVLDGLELAGSGRKYQRAADLATTVGLVGALAAAVPGAADWSRTQGGAKRVGFVHAALNLTIAGLYGGSLLARAHGRRKAGIGLSIGGFSLLMASAWLGGELAYKYGVGVRPKPEGSATEAERIGETRSAMPAMGARL